MIETATPSTISSPGPLSFGPGDSGWMACPTCLEPIRAILIRERCPVCAEALPPELTETRGPLRTRWDRNLTEPRFAALMVALLGLFQALVLAIVVSVGQ